MAPDWMTLTCREYWLLEYRREKDQDGIYSHRRIALIAVTALYAMGRFGWLEVVFIFLEGSWAGVMKTRLSMFSALIMFPELENL